MFKIVKGASRQGKRVLITGQGGLGKSSGVGKVTKNPLLLNLDNRWPMEFADKVHSVEGDLDWQTCQDVVKSLISDDKIQYKELIIDTATKLIEKAEAWAISTHFSGDKGKYVAYGAGLKVLKPAVAEFLSLVDALQNKHKIDVFVVAHSKVRRYTNPLQGEFDKFTLDLPDSISELFYQWADYVGFVHDSTQVEDKKVITSHRIITFQDSPVYQAKYSGSIDCPAKIPFDREGTWYTYISGEVRQSVKELDTLINSLPPAKKALIEDVVTRSNLRKKSDEEIMAFVAEGRKTTK